MGERGISLPIIDRSKLFSDFANLRLCFNRSNLKRRQVTLSMKFPLNIYCMYFLEPEAERSDGDATEIARARGFGERHVDFVSSESGFPSGKLPVSLIDFLSCGGDRNRGCFRRLDKCKFMDSKMRPLWLVYENADPDMTSSPDKDKEGRYLFLIFKNGDGEPLPFGFFSESPPPPPPPFICNFFVYQICVRTC